MEYAIDAAFKMGMIFGVVAVCFVAWITGGGDRDGD
jgi:hypothetical protein